MFRFQALLSPTFVTTVFLVMPGPSFSSVSLYGHRWEMNYVRWILVLEQLDSSQIFVVRPLTWVSI